MRSILSTLSLPRNGWHVLGVDLNCSESIWASSPLSAFPT